MGVLTGPIWTDTDERTGVTVIQSAVKGEPAIRAVNVNIDVPASCIAVNGIGHVSLPLPVEVVQHIFVLRAQDHGQVQIPFGNAGTPPQQAIAHVCPAWRRVALETGELWNNIIISKFDERTLDVAKSWLERAGNIEVTLKLCLLKTAIEDHAYALQTLCRPLRVRRLDMVLTSCQLAELSVLPDDAFSYLEETRIALHAHKYTPSAQLQPFFNRVQYLLCASGPCLDLLYSGCSSMKNLRHLDVQCVEMTPTQLIGILSQASLLESCRIDWYWEWLGNNPFIPEKNIILPNMKVLLLEFHRQRKISIVFDAICRFLAFPGLKKLALRHRGITSHLLSGVSERFNLPRLEELELYKTSCMTAKEVLSLTPLLRRATLSKHIVFDEEAMIGLSTGSLGRYLSSIKTNHMCDAQRMFTMVESRRKLSGTADPQNVGGHHRVTPFQYADFRTPVNAEKYAKDLDVFGELGIDIVMNGYPQERVRRVQMLDTDMPDMWSKCIQSPDVS
ncbi:hypothetical protein AX15_004560 [Amanita polypyramis BW_CC]|nr:hypothetical protein AX15_004560 [Amanita polypyramis BW_CC]